jgi:hypothetical protein
LAWRKILPKAGDSVTKVINGTSYHLACEYHPNHWAFHTSEECSKNPKNKGIPQYNKHNTDSTKKCLKAVRITAAALRAEVGDDDSEGDPDSYCKVGLKGLNTPLKSPFCLPLFHFLHALITWVIPSLCVELAQALVYLQATVWAFTETILKAT